MDNVDRILQGYADAYNDLMSRKPWLKHISQNPYTYELMPDEHQTAEGLAIIKKCRDYGITVWDDDAGKILGKVK